MFPAPKTKTIRNILEILVGDWKYTGTLNNIFTFILIEAFTLFDQQFGMSNSMYILVTHLCRYKNVFFLLGFQRLAEVWNRYGKTSLG